MSKKIFIVGGGYVGDRAAEILREQGNSVITGRRTPKNSTNTVYLDVLEKDSLPQELRAAEVVIYTVSAGLHSEDAYRKAYVTGVQTVLQNSDSAKRFIFVSSTGVYAQSDGSEVTETSETSLESFSGRLLIEGEALVHNRNGTVLRFSGIYGPGRERLLEEVRANGPIAKGRLEAYSNRIHREDCARAIAFLAAKEECESIYIGSDEQPTKLEEIVHWLATEMKVPFPRVSEGSAERGNKRCSSAKLRAEGFRFKYPTYREGFGEILGGRIV